MPVKTATPPRLKLRSRRDLVHFVARTTCLCVGLALACDVVNQLVFFVGWPVAIRSWIITVGIVVAIAVPVTRSIGIANLALYEASRTDPLTGLLNRRALLDTFLGPPPVIALIIVDLDRFKNVNDSFGHLAGDEVLRGVSKLLSAGLVGLGPIGRLGGEEFAVLATEGSEHALASELEAVRNSIASTPFFVDGTAVSVTISAGYARRTAAQSFNDLYARADRALYRAKAMGRNRIVSADELDASFDHSVWDPRQRGIEVVEGLSDALRSGSN